MDNITTSKAALDFMKQAMDSENGCVFMFIADGDHALKLMKKTKDDTVHLMNVDLKENDSMQFEMAFRMSAIDLVDMTAINFFENKRCPTTSTSDQQ